MGRRVFFGALGASSVALLSCQLLLGIDEPVGTARPVADGGTSVPDECIHAVTPTASNGVDDGSNIFGTPGLWFAATSYDVPYVDEAGVGQGLDLDNACTCNPDPLHRDALDGAPRCAPRTNAVTTHACDGDGGIDDAFGNVIESYFGAVPFADPRAAGNADIQQGISTALFWITGYNGEKDDPSVKVALVPSSGLREGSRCAGQPDRDASDRVIVADAAYYPPRFDGCDPWAPRSGELQEGVDGGVQPLKVNDAFVKDGIIHSTWRNQNVPVSFLGATMQASDAHFAAKLTRLDDGRYRIDGFVAGRLSADQLLATIGGTIVKMTGGGKAPLCSLDIFRQYLVPQLCEQLDVTVDPGADAPGTVCDAVSLVVGVHAVSTIIGTSAPDNANIFTDCAALGVSTTCP